MKKDIKRITLLILLILIFMMFVNSTQVFAWNWQTDGIDAMDGGKTTEANTSISNVMEVMVSVIRVVAAGVAIIMLTVVAMKYLMAAPGDKAEIKKHAVVYVVGAVALFATSGIIGIIGAFADTIS